jgi:hypothetical protein
MDRVYDIFEKFWRSAVARYDPAAMGDLAYCNDVPASGACRTKARWVFNCRNCPATIPHSDMQEQILWTFGWLGSPVFLRPALRWSARFARARPSTRFAIWSSVVTRPRLTAGSTVLPDPLRFRSRLSMCDKRSRAGLPFRAPRNRPRKQHRSIHVLRESNAGVIAAEFRLCRPIFEKSALPSTRRPMAVHANVRFHAPLERVVEPWHQIRPGSACPQLPGRVHDTLCFVIRVP